MKGSTILVPTDFLPASIDALATARELAGRLGLEIVLLHTYTIPVEVYPGFGPMVAPGFPAHMAAAAKGALDKLAAEQGGLRTMLRMGDPATQILQAIDELKPAMVAMGTHGRKGIERFLLGSVTEKVVRSSAAPVLTVHARPQ